MSRTSIMKNIAGLVYQVPICIVLNDWFRLLLLGSVVGEVGVVGCWVEEAQVGGTLWFDWCGFIQYIWKKKNKKRKKRKEKFVRSFRLFPRKASSIIQPDPVSYRSHHHSPICSCPNSIINPQSKYSSSSSESSTQFHHQTSHQIQKETREK